MRRFWAASAAVLFVTAPMAARAQDDLLAPLTPPTEKKKPATPPAAKKKVKKKGQLLVKLQGAKDAKLFIDDQEVAHLPGPAVEVAVGAHQVLVKKSGFQDFIRTLNIKPGETTELVATMEATGGTLIVETVPDGADVLVDGQPVGATPIKELVLPTGTYELEISREGYRNETARVSVRTGKEQLVKLTLKPRQETPAATSRLLPPTPSASSAAAPRADLTRVQEPEAPWYGRWYVWAGAAVVVAGATVGIIALTSSSARPSINEVCGSFSPGSTCTSVGGLSAAPSPLVSF